MLTRKTANIAVLVSGGGTNLQALINAQNGGIIKHGKIKLVISDNPQAYALERAKNENIEAKVVSKKDFDAKEAFENEIIKLIDEYEIDLIVLAGFLTILTEHFTSKFPRRIINVHPSLIPAFCGKGFYGLKVHEAAIERGVKVSGATVHFVNEIPDGGEIILQKSVTLKVNETPESLQKRIMRLAEWQILPKAVEKISREIYKGK